ncbi:MAG: glycosyl transferase family 1, partial [Planctomycetota bacterium]
MPLLEAYAPIVGPGTLEELSLVAERVRGRSVLHVNSTAVGGGVAEILHRMVPLFRELGLDARWEVIRGGEEFYAVTKKIHNALHGQPAEFSSRDFQVYREATAENLSRLALDAEVVFIHDPQPAALVEKRGALRNRWVWRCHIDLSRPNERVWG